MMDRRTFISAVAAAILAASRGASAQTATTVRRIGILSAGAPMTLAELQAEEVALRAFGWVEGKNLLFERRYANSSAELLQRFAEELVRLKVDIIVTWGTPATLAARKATTTLPIVMATAGDPVRAGLVASLSRPGGNITGFSIVGPEINAQTSRPAARVVAGLATRRRAGEFDQSLLSRRAQGFRAGVPVHRYRADLRRSCRGQRELENAIDEMARRRARRHFVLRDNLFNDNRILLMSAASRHGLPTIVSDIQRGMLEAGALISYAHTHEEEYQRNAAFIDRILRGAKPADLPIEQPTKFELIINLKAAKALGITIPQSLLLRADQVIQ
jgi:putative ABC transport system substrate-binding protein